MDLFEQTELQSLGIPDAEVLMLARLPLPQAADSLLAALVTATPWRCERIALWGKSYLQPRLTAWYGDPEARYRYSGLQLEPLPWTRTLLDLKARVEGYSKCTFNSVLLNYYRDHRDSMGMHADDEAELGTMPVIASLSLGEQRTLVLAHRHRTELQKVRIALTDGSLLLMKGVTQQYWKHGIMKQRRPCGPRINLTFRTIINSDGAR